MNLTPLHEEFVLHFGEMANRWGISRTVGQIYAVLFLSEMPLHAEEITARLGVSRSNVSMGLRELKGWNLVQLRHLPDDRRDYFTTPEDLWAIVRTLVEERRRREIDPTLARLRALEAEATGGDPYAEARIAALREMFETLTRFHDDMNQLETERLVELLRMGRKIGGLLEKTPRLNLFRRTAK